MNNTENQQWYTRAILSVTDVQKSLHYYINLLGFTQAWSHEDGNRTIVAQVNRGTDCELILSEDTSRAGLARTFISLDAAVLSSLQSELAAKRVEMEESWWGYPVIVIKDPDGNQMIFPIEET